MDSTQLYRQTVFTKLNFHFRKHATLLDVGCGDGEDADFLRRKYSLRVSASDIYKNLNIGKKSFLAFKIGSIYKLPYKDKTFDYVYCKDILHHIDEPKQRRRRHIQGLQELQRVCKKNGTIIIVEANRYNPIFYPHLVFPGGHNHFTQPYFYQLVFSAFPGKKRDFRHFEAHAYPFLFPMFRIYEFIMDRFMPRQFLAYNAAVICNKQT